MITISRLLGLTTLVALMLGVAIMTPGVSHEWFVDYHALVFIMVGTGAILVLGCDGKDWKNACRVAVGIMDVEDEDACHSAERFFHLASRSFISTGLVAYLVGMISMLGCMQNPSMIGFGVAANLVPILYGIVLSQFVCAPLLTWAAKGTRPEKKSKGVGSALLLCLMVVGLNLSLVFMMLLSVASV